MTKEEQRLEELQNQLQDFHGSQIIGIDTMTTVRIKGGKSHPLYNKIKKVSKNNLVMVFTSSVGFKNMVNRRLDEQIDLTADLLERISNGSFEPGPRPWGHRVPGTPFVDHKGKRYLECIFIKPGKSEYFIGSKKVKKEEIDHVIPQKTEGKQGGLRDKVIIRTFALDSIVSVRKRQTQFEGPAVDQVPA